MLFIVNRRSFYVPLLVRFVWQLEMDLFSLYVLISQFKPCDVLMEISISYFHNFVDIYKQLYFSVTWFYMIK